MSIHFFAIRIETHRLVAAEIHDRAAATLLAAGQQVLLGTVEELGKLATRLQRPLVTISRVPARSSPQRNPILARVSHPQPSPTAPEPRSRPAQREELCPVSVSPAGDRPTGVSVARVA